MMVGWHVCNTSFFFSFKHGCTPNSLINVSLFENTEAILRIKEKKKTASTESNELLLI